MRSCLRTTSLWFRHAGYRDQQVQQSEAQTVRLFRIEHREKDAVPAEFWRNVLRSGSLSLRYLWPETSTGLALPTTMIGGDDMIQTSHARLHRSVGWRRGYAEEGPIDRRRARQPLPKKRRRKKASRESHSGPAGVRRADFQRPWARHDATGSEFAGIVAGGTVLR